jgi:hypothetical protein
VNKTHEKEGTKQISDLSGIRNNNLRSLNGAKAHTRYVKTELTDTVNYIAWIKSRKIEVARKLKAIGDQRCYSNAMFIKALKEHKDALDVIELLKQDLGGYAAGKVSLAQMSDVSDKLSAYSHLFQDAALKEFIELGNEKNFKVAKLKGGKSEARNLKGNLGKKIVALLTQLQAHLRSSLKDLEASEIRASYDLASFIVHSEREIKNLDKQLVRKVKYQKKLTIDYEVSKNHQKKTQKDYEDSVRALSKAIDDLKRKRAYYASETARRSSENTTLDEVIAVFKSKVAGVSKYLRGRMESFKLKGKFAKHNTHMKKAVLRSSRRAGKRVARRAGRKAGKKAVLPLKTRVAIRVSKRKAIIRKHKKNAIRLLKKVAIRHAVAKVHRRAAKKAGKKVSKRSAKRSAKRASKRAAKKAGKKVSKRSAKKVSKRSAKKAAKKAARKSAKKAKRSARHH